jgi:hypothetical protein
VRTRVRCPQCRAIFCSEICLEEHESSRHWSTRALWHLAIVVVFGAIWVIACALGVL